MRPFTWDISSQMGGRFNPPLLPHIISGGIVAIDPQSSLQVRRVMVGVGLIPLPPPPLLAAQLQRHGRWHQKSSRTKALALGVVPWSTHFLPVCPTPLVPCLVVRGRVDITPTPFPLEVGVMGVG